MAGLIGAATAQAFATNDPPQYILIPCGDMASDDKQILMFGINNHGETVGLRLDANDNPLQAMLWLPFPAYSENEGLLSLDAKTGFGNSATQSGDGTIAFDINDAGMAVGSYENNNPNPVIHDAVVWKVATESDESVVGRFAGYSINDDSPAIVTGGSGECWETVLPFLPSSPNTAAAFVHEVAGTTTDLSAPTSFSPVGYGVADASTGNDALVVGHADCSGFQCPTQICGARWNGAYWSDHDAMSAELEPYARINGISAFVVGHAAELDATDQATHVVGFGHNGMDDFLCQWYGLYWDDSLMSQPFNLPLLNASSDDTEMALDVRNGPDEDDLEIVGRNFTQGKAIAWRFDASASSWTTVDLSGAVSGVIDDLRTFSELNCATGINDDGWITVWGLQGPSPFVIRSGVLIPYDEYRTNVCPGDIAGPETINPDGEVDLFDLLVLLNTWGTDGEGADIAAPFDVVNLFDLLTMIDDWGCFIGVDPNTLTFEQELNAVGLTTDDWDEFEDVMTSSQSTEKQKQQYKCWMENYLTGCSVCPPCPSSDPYQ